MRLLLTRMLIDVSPRKNTVTPFSARLISVVLQCLGYDVFKSAHIVNRRLYMARCEVRYPSVDLFGLLESRRFYFESQTLRDS